jgi:cell division septal protein FtsQ
MGRKSRVAKLIQKQKPRNRGPRLALPEDFGAAVLLTCKIALFLALLAGFGAMGYGFYRFAFRSNYFELKKLVITGVSDDVAAELRALTELEPNHGVNLLLIRSKRVREILLHHPRIASARVAKHYPNALVIHAAERVPVAIVAGGALYVIDREGCVLDRIAELDRSQSQFPYITGVDPEDLVFGQPIPNPAVVRALDLHDCLRIACPRVLARLSEIRIGKDQGLTMILVGGVEVRLGAADFAKALARLDLLVRQRPNLDSVEYIDLRFDEQIVYKDRRTGEANGT